MTPEYARMALPLIQALADGKQLEWRPIGHDAWFPWVEQATFSFRLNEYRVKASAREEWMVQIIKKLNAYGYACGSEMHCRRQGLKGAEETYRQEALGLHKQITDLLDNIPKED